MSEDVTIVCLCGQPFTFSAGERKFFEQKGFQQPKRCPDCRAKKRRERERAFREDAPFPEDEGYR